MVINGPRIGADLPIPVGHEDPTLHRAWVWERLVCFALLTGWGEILKVSIKVGGGEESGLQG